MNNTTIKSWIVWASGYSAGQVILANQSPSNPVPTGDHITFEVIADVDDGGLTVIQSAPVDTWDVERTLFDRHMVTVSVEVYAADGPAVLGKLKKATALPEIRDIFGYSIAFISASTARNLTGIEDTTFAPRYQADFEFREATEWTVPIDRDDGIWDEYYIEGEIGGDTVVIES